VSKVVLEDFSHIIFEIAHLDLNFDLRSNLEEIESYLNLDTLEAYRLDTESVLILFPISNLTNLSKRMKQ